MPTEGVWISPSGKKVFIPLENNPEVFTSLVHDLGVSPELGFYDVYSLDEPELLSLIPRPAHSLIFITPAPMYWATRKEHDGITEDIDGKSITYDKTGEEEPIVWYRQTIGNACGFIALLHTVSNGNARRFVKDESLLARLLKEGRSLKPDARAEMLYNSEELEQVHMRAAKRGDSGAPRADEHCGYHFLAFTKGEDGHLWELEGGVDGPIDRGLLPEGADMLSEEALEKGVRRFMKHADGNVEFSIVALANQS